MSTSLVTLVRVRRVNYNLRKSPHLNSAGTSRNYRDDPTKSFPENVWVVCEKLAERGIDACSLSREATEAWANHFLAGGPEPAPAPQGAEEEAAPAVVKPPTAAVISGPNGAEIELHFAIYTLLAGAIALAEYRDRGVGSAERMKKLNAVAEEYLKLSNARSGSTDNVASDSQVDDGSAEVPLDTETTPLPNPG